MLLPFLLSSMTSLSLKLKPYLEESTESVLLGNSVFTGHHSMRSDLELFEYILYFSSDFFFSKPDQFIYDKEQVIVVLCSKKFIFTS